MMCGMDGAGVATFSCDSMESAASELEASVEPSDRLGSSVPFRLRAGLCGVDLLHRVGSSASARRFRRRAGSSTAGFLEKWSPPNEHSGSPSVATPMTRAVGSSVWRRESRRVFVGAVVRWRLFEALAGAFPRLPRHSCRSGGSCESRGRGGSNPWHPGASDVR